MKKKKIKFLTGVPASVFLLLAASFLTVLLTLFFHRSEPLRQWLQDSRHFSAYSVKTLLTLLWIYPSFCLLYTIYRNKDWQQTLSVLIGMLLLFFATVTLISFIIDS